MKIKAQNISKDLSEIDLAVLLKWRSQTKHRFLISNYNMA